MSKSILSNENKCYVCGSKFSLHKHHVYYGVAHRKLAEKYGCWVYLCSYHHNGSNNGVHFNKELDLALKKEMQQAFEKTYPNIDFRTIFRKSYL